MSTPLFTAEDMVALGKAMAGIGEAFTSMASVLVKAGDRVQAKPAPAVQTTPWTDNLPTSPGVTIEPPAVRVEGDSKCVAATTPAPVEQPKPVFRPADKAYPDLPRCGECGRPMRPMGSKAVDWPGTINRVSTTCCGTCYTRKRNRDKGAVPRKPKADTAVSVRIEPELVSPIQSGESFAPVPTPAELKQAREAKDREAQAKKRQALKAEARHQAKVDTAAEREARLQRELDSYLAARHKRGVPPEGVVMPGEQPDKPNASKG